MAETPSAQVRGLRATPGAVATLRAVATPGPDFVRMTERDMDQFRDRLRVWATGTPQAQDVAEMAERARVIAAQLHVALSQMTPEERERALARMSDIFGEMAQVVQAQAGQGMVTGTPGPMMGGQPMMGTPGPMMGTPGPMMGAPARTPMMQRTPVAGGTVAEQIADELDQIRAEAMRLAGGQVTRDDVLDMLGNLRAVAMAMRQELGQLSDEELDALTGQLAAAVDDLAVVVRGYLRQQYGFVPTMTPTETPTMTPTEMPTMTPTEVPILAPSPTLMP